MEKLTGILSFNYIFKVKLDRWKINSRISDGKDAAFEIDGKAKFDLNWIIDKISVKFPEMILQVCCSLG